jgi:ABC-type Na+ efflux pump permease subunit
MVVMGVILVLAVLGFGILFLRIHSLPERMAHRGHKLQFEIVAVLCLISLFTHMHIFWIAGLLLALIDLPDFGTPLNRIAGSAEKMAGLNPGEGATKMAYDEHVGVEPVETRTDLSTEIGTEKSAALKQDAELVAPPAKSSTKSEGRTGSKKERTHA